MITLFDEVATKYVAVVQDGFATVFFNACGHFCANPDVEPQNKCGRCAGHRSCCRICRA